MKKTYISPESLLVELRCTQMLAESVGINSTTTTTGTNGGWVKEDNSPITDKNIWDEEW